MNDSRDTGTRLRQRLSGEQHKPPSAAASPAESDAGVQEVRQGHVEKALHEAVTAGRLSPESAQEFLGELARGSDPHALRRQLRAAGVRTRRSAHKKQR